MAITSTAWLLGVPVMCLSRSVQLGVRPTECSGIRVLLAISADVDLFLR